MTDRTDRQTDSAAGVYSAWYKTSVHEYVWCAAAIGVFFLFGTGVNHGAEIVRAVQKRQHERQSAVKAAQKAKK